MTNRVHARRAFTLVELLVVIGIIAILIAILLPTIAGANRAAKTTACAAGLRSLGQALTGYVSEYKSYPFGSYIAAATSAAPDVVGDGGQAEIDRRTYTWWSVLRGYMRGKGAPMDNSIVADNGSTLTRFMEAFNCPMGLNRDAGCDFVCNAAVMPWKHLEEGLDGHTLNKRVPARPQKATGVYPDTIVLWDAPEIAPNFNTQYVVSFAIDEAPGSGKEVQSRDGLLATPKKPSWRYRNVDSNDKRIDAKNHGDNFPIYTGLNEEVTSANVNDMAGGIRFRHGRNDQANFLFADGSVKTFSITKNWDTGPRGELLRKYFRSKLPSGMSPIDLN